MPHGIFIIYPLPNGKVAQAQMAPLLVEISFPSTVASRKFSVALSFTSLDGKSHHQTCLKYPSIFWEEELAEIADLMRFSPKSGS